MAVVKSRTITQVPQGAVVSPEQAEFSKLEKAWMQARANLVLLLAQQDKERYEAGLEMDRAKARLQAFLSKNAGVSFEVKKEITAFPGIQVEDLYRIFEGKEGNVNA